MESNETARGRALREMLAPYRGPDVRKSVLQLATSAIPFFLLWALMLRSLEVSYGLTLLLAIPTAGFLLRLFMIQHDCGHGPFFRSRRINSVVGTLIGILTLVPYAYWRRTHALHHSTAGDLDERGFGDIETKTVREYAGLSRFGKLRYRLYRHPLVMFGLGPTWQFVLKHRLPLDTPRSWKREWRSVHLTNVALLLILLVMWQTIGLRRFLLVQIPITVIAGSIGVWLFYIQHQFEGTYWRPHSEWDYFDAAQQGSSYYDLPRVLRWFTADIGLHHIHHMNSQIPNYRLQRCFDENPELRKATRLTLRSSLRCLRLALWDEETRRLVSFREAKLLHPA